MPFQTLSENLDEQYMAKLEQLRVELEEKHAAELATEHDDKKELKSDVVALLSEREQVMQQADGRFARKLGTDSGFHWIPGA